MRTELEVCTKVDSRIQFLKVYKTRMVHINPSELLLPEKGLSDSTDKMLAHFAA